MPLLHLIGVMAEGLEGLILILTLDGRQTRINTVNSIPMKKYGENKMTHTGSIKEKNVVFLLHCEHVGSGSQGNSFEILDPSLLSVVV